MQADCDYCRNLAYDEELEEYVCGVEMDEDDEARLALSGYRGCPYFQMGDDYSIVKHQM
ncbi:MAG: hypothetical protein IJL66_03280 [Lachnospiraceae bacterium]|nr:hypothetical protein [Lachnospiraceae bacterium]